jgi:hypothetical protein
MGLYSNIHAKRQRIKNGSGETMKKKGDKGAPTETNFKEAQKTALKSKTFDVPPSVRKAAKKGLELRRIHGRGGLSIQEASKLGIGSGVARARDLIKGSISFDTVKRMHGYFSRSADDAKAEGDKSRGFWGDDTKPSAGYIAFLLWGGAAGKRWVEGILAGLD